MRMCVEEGEILSSISFSSKMRGKKVSWWVGWWRQTTMCTLALLSSALHNLECSHVTKNGCGGCVTSTTMAAHRLALSLRGGMTSSSEEAVREAKFNRDHEESYARDRAAETIETEEEPTPLDDTLEKLLRHDAELVGDAQSLREYADFLQTAHKDLSRARLLYTRALQLEPANVRAHSNLGRLAHQGGELAVAERHYRAALLLDPLDLDTLSYSAVLAQAQNDLERANECYMQALAVAPYHAACHSNYATLLLERAARRHSAAPNAHAEKCTHKGSDAAEKSGHMERAEWHLEQVNPKFTFFTSTQVLLVLVQTYKY